MAQTYPPPDHVLRDLGLEIRREEDRPTVRLPAGAGTRNRAGAVSAGALGVAVDVLGGNLALEALRPDWCVTSSLELHLLRPQVGDLVVRGAPLRAGRTHVVIDAEVEGPGSGLAGVASMTFTRLPRRPDTPEYAGAGSEPVAFGPPGAALDTPLLEGIGAEVLDGPAGVVELPMTPYVQNSVGGLQGGLVVALVDAAGESVAASRLGETAVTVDLLVHFLALARVGPIRSRTRWLVGGDDEARLRVELVDRGQDDRLVAVASLRVAPLEMPDGAAAGS